MKMIYVLVAAIVGGAAAAAARSGAPSSTAASPRVASPVAADPAPLPAVHPTPGHGSDAAEIQGEVLEVIQVPKYSYLRIGKKGTEGKWTAVSTASTEVGHVVRIGGATRMTDFRSAALRRTFPVIYFGALEGPSARSSGPHGADPHAGAEMHAPAAKAIARALPVARASGPNGMTVAEVHGRRAELEGKAVRVHATVVKANPGILGKTFLHVRDGSGDAAAGTHDLAVTTAATPAVGDTVTLEGVVVRDLDLGAGYKFATLVENAALVER